MLHVPQTDGKPVLRAYSIASSDQDNTRFHLLFKYIPNGIASEYVWHLKGQELLSFTGPFGKLLFKEPPTQQMIFLNTGTGLAQHYSYLISNLGKYPKHQFRMLFGLPNPKEIYYKKELENLSTVYPNFKYDFVFSDPSSSPTMNTSETLKTGYLQDQLENFKYLETPTTFYLCGNRSMLCSVRDQLQESGFNKENILCEAFD